MITVVLEQMRFYSNAILLGVHNNIYYYSYYYYTLLLVSARSFRKLLAFIYWVGCWVLGAFYQQTYYLIRIYTMMITYIMHVVVTLLFFAKKCYMTSCDKACDIHNAFTVFCIIGVYNIIMFLSLVAFCFCSVHI